MRKISFSLLYSFILSFLLFCASQGECATLIKIVTVKASSQRGSWHKYKLVDGSGLVSNNLHDTNYDNMWNAETVIATLTFDFGAIYDVSSANVWNYNYGYLGSLDYGSKSYEILVSNDGENFLTVKYVTLTKGTGELLPPQTIEINAEARWIRFQIWSNYGGWFSALSEVQFFGVCKSEYSPPDTFALEAGDVFTYSRTCGPTYTVGRQMVDTSLLAPADYKIVTIDDGKWTGTDHYERTASLLSLWGVEDSDGTWTFSKPLIAAWYPMKPGDHRYSVATVYIYTSVFNVSMTVDVLSKELAYLPFGHFEAYKCRYKFRVWGHGKDESETFYKWLVPYLGAVKSQYNECLETLTDFAIARGKVTPDSDADGDGLGDYQEIVNYGTNWEETDTDQDGMPDGWEVDNGLDPLVNDALEDPDEDEYTNLKEYRRRTDPRDPNSYPSEAMPWIPLLLLGY